MRLPVPGPRDVISALERGGGQVEALLGAVPRVLALLDRAEAVLDRAETMVGRAGTTIGNVEAVVEAAAVEVARVSAVVDAAAGEVERVAAVVDGAVLESARVATVVDVASTGTARIAALIDDLEPSLTKLQPTLRVLADTTHPDEVAALVTLVDHLPALTDQVERDLLPVLKTLESVAPDLHDLLNVSRELNEILGKIPGIGRIKRRVEEEDEEIDAATR
ncbi:hypothetical protein Q9S36_47000 [Microbacterium sp. ARD31]|uniref:hypothetical protein n=1 Tax=Microbacterium sp. ARD31 TaxID=2962576 RepID=UPI002881DADF|nr:hypothetical protein [Microbacterium sp. ARD31]MDT0187758.1 hypothetical protein [Microbacterium sp. ARD31]